MVVVPRRCLELEDLRAGLDAQRRVEVRERLVHQERGRLADDRAAERDPLALTAGELLRLALEQRAELEDLGCLAHAPVDLASSGTLKFLRLNARFS